MAASDNPASRKLSEPIEAAIVHLIEVVQKADGYGADIHRVVEPSVERLRVAIRSSLLPAEMTPEIGEVLGLMIFRTGPVAHLYRAAGHAIRSKIEDEQAFVLFRYLHLALRHGPGWFAESCIDLSAAHEVARAKLDGQKQQSGGAS